MMIRPLLCTAVLLSISGISRSAVYKCDSVSGRVSYQDTPCVGNALSSEIEIERASVKAEATSKMPLNQEPSGQWVGVSNYSLNAIISKSGNFSMTDKFGSMLSGTWTEVEYNTYVVNASFQGMIFPVSMKYDEANDSLKLSKPGFPNSFNTYTRQ